MAFSIKYIFLGILTLFTPFAIFPCIYAQTHDKTLYELTKQSPKIEVSHIDVGKEPFTIKYVANEKVYVANSGSNTVSVIDATTNEKTKDIVVGKFPFVIGYSGNTVYVANSGSDTVSVINASKGEKIKDIAVGKFPKAIDSSRDAVYVANSGSNTVSVINATTNEKTKDIAVGVYPWAIYSAFDNLYVANLNSDTVSVINATTNEVVKNIAVGFDPMAINSFGDSVYVANYASNTGSVINATTNEKTKDIAVGDKPNILDFSDYAVYVANSGSDTVSVINATTNEKTKDIAVGKFPFAMYSSRNTVYVANSGSNTVSVINATTNEKIKDIAVGDKPGAISSFFDTVYVTNYGSDGVSVIDGISNEVVAGVKFNVHPINSGYIECNKLKTPTEHYLYVYSGDKCTAKASKGFEFQSWQMNLKNNATLLLNTSSSTSSWDSVLDIFNLKKDKPEATISITKFGSFTANFNELPPPLPPEYWATLFGFVVTTILGTLLIPAIVRWFKSRSDIKNLNKYHKIIAKIYADEKQDENDIASLNHLSGCVSDDYSRGKINKEHYESLKNEVSSTYEEIFRKRLHTINPSEKDSKEKVKELRDDILYAFSKGKINETHYNMLKETIGEDK